MDLLLGHRIDMTASHLNVVHSATNMSHVDDTQLGLLSVVIVSVVTNTLVVVAVKVHNLLHLLTYYFLASMSLVHILMSLSAMLLTLIINLGGVYLGEDVCKLWITLDFFFCNSTFLHLAFLNMDAYLHLKDPIRHGRTPTTCSTCLWLCAPWAISTVQGLAQFMLSQGDHEVSKNGVCIVSDKNFVLLGMLFSFMIPAVVAVIFYLLSVYEVISRRKRQCLDGSDNSTAHNPFPVNSDDCTEEEWSDCSEDCAPEQNQHTTPPKEQVELSIVKHSNESTPNHANEPINTTAVSVHAVPEIQASITQHPTCNTDMLNSYYADQILSVDLTTNSCTLLLRDPHENPSQETPANSAANEQVLQNGILHNSRFTTKWIFMVLISMICLWAPLLISNLVYGLCSQCRDNLNLSEINIFKWLAYSSAIVGPVIYIIFSDLIRHGIIHVIVCKCLRKK